MRHSTSWSGRLWPLLALALVASAGCGGGADHAEKKEGGSAADSSKVPMSEIGTYLHIVIPSIAEKDESVRLRLRVVTEVGVPDYDFDGAFRIEGRGTVEFPKPLAMEPDPDGFYFTDGIKFHSTGVQFLRGLVPKDTVKAMANPVNVVDHAEYRIYWGDLNGHSERSSGIRPPSSR